MSRQVDFTLHAEQDDTYTRLVLHVEGDPPVTLVEYERAIAERAMSVSMLKVGGDGLQGVEHYTAIQVTFSKERA